MSFCSKDFPLSTLCSTPLREKVNYIKKEGAQDIVLGARRTGRAPVQAPVATGARPYSEASHGDPSSIEYPAFAHPRVPTIQKVYPKSRKRNRPGP